MNAEFQRKAEEYGKAYGERKKLISKMIQSGTISDLKLEEFRNCAELAEIDRHTLTNLVKRIYVYENKRIEIEFYFQDEYQIMRECVLALSDSPKDGERNA